MNEIRLVINKDGVAEMLPEPFATIEVQTEEDMKNIEDAVKKSVVANISLDKKTKEFLCPNCNKILSFEDNYCSKCGQKYHLEGITKGMIYFAYVSGIAEIKSSPYNDGVVCYIGEEWFYVGSHDSANSYLNSENYSVKKYKEKLELREIVDNIYSVLDNYRKSGEGYTESYFACYKIIKDAVDKATNDNGLNLMDTLPSEDDDYLVAYASFNGNKCNLTKTSFCNGNWDFQGEYPVGWYKKDEWRDLYETDITCNHTIIGSSGGGVHCTKCTAWFAF